MGKFVGLLLLMFAVMSGVEGSVFQDEHSEGFLHDHGPGLRRDGDHKLCQGFLPENHFPKYAGQKTFNNVGEAEFNDAISKVEAVYAPIVRQKGAVLKVLRNWNKMDVNAFANRQGSTWTIDIFGGLVRRTDLTADGLTLVTCHEVGHHLGGAPLYTGDPWAAVEGQADYFATLKCLRRVFLPEVDTWNGFVDREALLECEESFGSNTKESKLCGRIAMAGKSAAALQGGNPRFDLPDPKVVTKTFESHPQGQCRMDTYFRGSLCKTSVDIETSPRDHNKGVCRNIAEENYGARPLCWYKPVGGGTPTPPPPPPDGIANKPLLGGKEEIISGNPNQAWTLTYDVTNFSAAYGVYIEIIGPNRQITKPNGTVPEPRSIQVGSIPRRSGSIRILPAQQLPGWGKYYFRVIPLDKTGRKPVGQFSNPSVLILER